ncbi:MAG TPA: RNA 2',3'-cyclic phosphodiesterase [Candidatus Limnocylindrales bacterium]|nr:RNA 2',3'-cyclic phosphodiesterase [Candidatus Limnocylindrales bacterium]
MRPRVEHERRAPEEAGGPEPRLFIAVPLAEVARAAIQALVDEVRGIVEANAREPRSQVRWVRMDGLHLTLRFLGPTHAARIPALSRALSDVAAATETFRVEIRGSGAFPSSGRPRSIWLGIDEGHDELAALAARLGDRLADEGVPRDDRPFRAHLTLARSDGRREGPLVARTLAARAAESSIPFTSDRAVLFESLTGGGPARYVAVHEAPFRE